RVTRDVDALVFLDEDNIEGIVKLGQAFGFGPRVHDAVEFARRNRVLLVNHEPTGIEVDLSLAALPFEQEALARAEVFQIQGVAVPLPTAEDLIIMKAVANRERDLVDIRGILDTHPKLNLRRVRRWVKDFAAVADRPEILDDLEKLLAHRGSRRPK